MKLKINLGCVALLGALSLSSCSDFLEITPQEIIVLDKFWNEKADVESVVAGCYTAMQSDAVVSRMMVWGEFRSDNIVGGTNYENDVNIANVFKENINASNTYTKWGDVYAVINRCNTVIHYAPSVAEKDPNYTQSELNATIAEVSALRDLMYFYLIRTYRDVPYVTEPYLDDNQVMDLEATPFDEVLSSLIADLEAKQSMAVRRYPSTQRYYQQGRITQDAIHAMLCDMYLWKGDYQKAVDYADLVIKAKQADYEARQNASSMMMGDKLIDGYPLVNDSYTTGSKYGSAFDNIFGEGNSDESIFELVFMNSDDMMANSAVDRFYGNATTYPGLVRPADFICTDVSDEMFNVYLNKYDTRYHENIRTVSTNSYGIAKYAYSSAMVDLSKAEITTSFGDLWTEGKCHANWVIYRLTDVMLMKAEALVEMAADEGEDAHLTEALAIVNAVSKRSNCSSAGKDLDATQFTTKALMRTLVIEERQRELMFEGKRWYDLVRRSRRDGNTNYLVGVVSRKGSSGGGALSSKLSRMEAIYWPYNIDELKVNSHLVQNPAFGSGENSSIERN